LDYFLIYLTALVPGICPIYVICPEAVVFRKYVRCSFFGLCRWDAAWKATNAAMRGVGGDQGVTIRWVVSRREVFSVGG
jgi:hypothetical protein